MIEITSDDFREWGAWARDNKMTLKAKSAWLAVTKDNVKEDEFETYNITDEKADLIDRAVCALTNKNPTLGNVFTAHYVNKMSYRDLAKVQKCTKSAVNRQLDTAGGIVIGYAMGESYVKSSYKKP